MGAKLVFKRAFPALLALVAAPAFAGPDQASAGAELTTPIDIIAQGDLVFGTVAIPRSGDCSYTVSSRSEPSATQREECRFLSGEPLAGEFSVSCGANQTVTFEAIFTNAAPTGALFSAGDAPMEIDGLGAGEALQIRPCDKDGFSEVRVGGTLTVSPGAPDGFSGEVGTIRLEANY